MEFKTKKTGGATAEITINHTAEEVEEAFQNVYRKKRSSVKIPGFRQGKAPLEMVEKKLGDSVLTDAANDLIQRTYEQIIEQIDPAPINVPSFGIESFDRKEGAVFVGQYETMPEVKLGKYKKIKVDEDYGSVEDSTVDAEIENLRKQKAVLNPREDQPARKGDLVTISLELKEGETILYQTEETRFKVGDVDFPPQINEQIEGKKEGEQISYEAAVDEDFPGKDYAGKTIVVQIGLKQVQEEELPELDDEFAKEQGEFETFQQYREDLKSKFLEAANSVLRNRTTEKVLKAIIDDTKMDIPESLINGEYDQRLKQVRERVGDENISLENIAMLVGRDPGELEHEFQEMAKQAAAEKIVLKEIAEKEELVVTDEDIDREFDTRWAHYLDGEQMENLKHNEGLRDELKNRLLYSKSLDWLYENSERKKGASVSYESLLEEGAFG